MKQWIAIGALSAVSFSASAADMPFKARPPVVAPWSWTGGYIGGQVGMSTAAMSIGAFNYNAAYDFGKGDAAQTLAGVHAGYNYQTNGFVLGVEGDLNAKFGEGYFGPVNARILSPWDASIRGRLGILPTPQSLLYVTGGGAFGSFKTEAANKPNFDSDGNELGSPDFLGDTRVGWTLGGGAQYALDRNWSTRIEYRYTDWGSKGVNWNTGTGPG